MKKSLFYLSGLFIILSLALSSCSKDDDQRLLSQDKKDFADYLVSEGISVDPNESGIYYIETTKGEGFASRKDAYVTIVYSLKTITGKIVDDESEFVIDLLPDFLIPGFYEGLLMMNQGGRATIIIPSELAYGISGRGPVEANMSLVFQVYLKEVKGEFEAQETLKKYIEKEQISVLPTDKGLYFISIKEGTGDFISKDDYISIKYKGSFLDGSVFDQTKDGASFSFNYLSYSLIPGFEQALAMMKKGGSAKVIIPSNLAYGSQAKKHAFMYTNLIFEIEVLE